MQTGSSEKTKSTKGSNEGSGGTGSTEAEGERKDRSKSTGSKEGTRESRGRFFSYSSRGRGDRGKNRGRGRDDYGYSRSRYFEERRGGFRGRYSRRGGRDDDNSYGHRSRYQDSMKSRSDLSSSNSSKFYSGSDHRGKPDMEDSRISTTLRRMAREEDETIFNNLCYHLQNSLTLAENEVYIRRSMDTIDESLLDMVRYFQKDNFRLSVAKCLGHVGFNLGKEFHRYMDWIFRKINNENSVKTREYLLKGILELAQLDSENPKLGDFSKHLIKELHMIMESTDIADIYMLTAETILILTKHYPYHFAESFHDTIDIIVGWHIDSTQPAHIADFSSECLRSLSEYWIQDIKFTVSLLTQILEDAQIYSDEVTLESSPSDEAFSKTTNFIRVFRAVFEGAKDAMDPSVCKKITWTFHSDAITQIFNIVLKITELHIHCPVICAGNYCSLAIMKYLKYKTDTVQTTLFKFISKQLDIGNELDIETIQSLLALIAKVIGESGFKLPGELIDRLFSSSSLVLAHRFTSLRPELISLYQALLKRKDVKLVKSAYSHMISDLNGALKILFPDMDPILGSTNIFTTSEYDETNVEIIVKFYFDTFQIMSKTGGSLFWIYLVKPSLFDLFAVKLVHLFTPLEYPSLFHSVVVLLKSHCSLYGEFVLTSKLLKSSVDNPLYSVMPADSTETDKNKDSPTENHLSIIMKLVGNLLKMGMSEDTKLVLLLWCKDILSKIKPYYADLHDTEELSILISGVTRAAMDRCRKIALASAKCVYLFADNFNQTWKMEHLIKVMNLCTTYVNSASRKLQAIYLRIVKLLPSLTFIFGVQHYCKDPRGYKRNLESSLYASMTRGDTGEIQDIHFRKIMEYIFHGHNKLKYCERYDNGWLEDIVSRCWAVLEFELGQRSMSSERALLEWGAWQCANLTVNQRLKTSIGKPAETLVTIENALNELCREVVSGKISEGWRAPMNGQRVRLLIQFIEHLEKLIYNAVEGTAYALSAPPQSVKSFFMTNKGTCVEWLNRVRLTLMFICLHAGLASYTVRHGQAYLQHLMESNNIQGWEFKTGVTYVAWALSNLREPEAVFGVYSWAKEKGVKMPALRALSLKSACRYEEAIDEFLNLVVSLSDSELSQDNETDRKVPSSSRKTFIADHLTECYLALNDWEELTKWKQAEKNYLCQENGNTFHLHKYMDEDYVTAMKLLEKGEKEAASKLVEWKDSGSNNTPTWNYYNLIYSTSYDLSKIAVALQITEEESLRKMMKDKVKVCRQEIDEIIKESLKESTGELFPMATVLKYVAASLYNDLNHLDNQVNEVGKSIKKRLRNPEMSEILWWSSVLKDMPRKAPSSQLSTDFNLMLSRVARKEGNTNLARVCLLRYLSSTNTNVFNLQMTIQETAEATISFANFGNSPEKLTALDQLTKLLKRDGDEEKACQVMIERIKMSSLQPESKSKSLVNLAYWIHCDSKLETSQLSDFLTKPNIQGILTSQDQPSNELADYLKEKTSLTESDSLVKSLLQESLVIWPGLAKAWACLAEVSYSWARCLASKNIRQPSLDLSSLPQSVDPEVLSNLIIKTPPTIHLDDIEVEASVGVESFEMHLSEQGQLSEEEITLLIKEWRKFHAPIYNYFTLSAYSYFKFLQNYSDKGYVVLATLRLVRLLVKHPEEMEPLYQVLMSETPTSPWVCVVPQLFSRLSHPHSYPRKKIAELLVRIGTDYPHLISFPAVVGSKTGVSTIKDMPNTMLFATNQNADDNGGSKEEELDEEIRFFVDEEEPETYLDDDESNNKDESTAILENSFITIVDSLSKQCGNGMINEVGVLVSELRRITVLWDELWLGTLKHRHADTARRFSRLSAETEVTLANQHLSEETKNSLIRQKHSLILKPLLFVLEQLHSITSVPPETPHELQFQEKYSEIIEETLKALREPTNPENPEEACAAVKWLEKALSGGSEGKPAVYSMSEISPVLAGFKDTCIAMPGLDRPTVTIKSVIDTVQVLATMTKPKKLIFIGSDGKEYTYLFKGLEDLHLDERIMQFLSTANSMLKDESLRARHYSVVPLGPRSGLISWVDSVTPIFSIYKRWQQRDQQPNSKVWFGVARPSELYYSVLTPLLTEAGLKADPAYRSTWPLYLLKKALSLLTKQTPNHLLSKELWCYSGSGGSWWESTKLYSTSLGVMSMIGYIIGLGDRHLDNVMVNLRTGQVVHIDYNVCFEKGKTLRIPEKVPYRLTSNLIAALGITGIQGLFHSTCEKVLGVLQKEKETLLTLLEAFVYDPLIDWTPLNETGYTGAVYGGGRGFGQEIKQTRRQLERQVTVAMFSVRVVEISHQWTINKEKIRNELSIFVGMVEQWLKNNEQLDLLMSKLQERHSQMALLKEAEGQPTHPLYTLGNRYETYSSVYGSKQQVISSLSAKLHEAELLITHYQSVIEVLRSQELTKYLRELNSRPKKDLCTVFDLIKEFLQNAGQNQMVLQCAESERQMCQITAEQNELTASLIELLSQYWEIARNYPASYVETHRSSLYKKWACLLLEDMSPQRCSQVEYEMNRELCLREDTMVSLSRYYSDLVRLAEAASTEAMRPLPILPHVTKDQPMSRQSLSSYSELQVVAAVCNALIATNCKFLRLESAATGAGEYLVNLMSREGNWFLEDMVTLSCIVEDLLALLPPPQPDSNMHRICKTLSAIHSQYKALQEMDLNVRGIILFEAMQSMRSEEPTVLLAASVLENLALSSEKPLAALADSLYLKIKNILNPNAKIVEDDSEMIAGGLQQGFASVMSSLDSTEVLSPGQMLLLGFNGLFSDLEINTVPVSKLFASLDLPPLYHCIDHIADSKQYPVEVCSNERGVNTLSLYLSVCRIQAMVETLGGCSLDAEGWKTGTLAPGDPAHLARPVRNYIANYVRSCLLGLLPRTVALAVVTLLSNYGLDIDSVIRNGDGAIPNRIGIEEFCNKFIELKLGGKLPAQLVKLVDHAAVETRHNEVLRVKDREASQARASLARQTLLTTAFHWLHEHYLLASPPPPINRAHFMLEVRKTMAALLNLQAKINEAVDQQQTLINSAEQRLRWASGANPALTEVLSAFENSVSSHRQKLLEDQRKAVQVSNFANWVLQYEALRTPTNEALNNDATFAVLVKECSKCYFIREQNQVNVSSIEEGLVSLVPPPPAINHQWISTAEQLISESIRSLNKDVEPLQKELFAAEDCIKSKSLTLRYDMGTHNKIISDIRELFKTMIKFEDAKEMGLENYLFRYKEYTDKMSRMTKWFTNHEPFSEKKLTDALVTGGELLALTDDVYEDLLKLSFSESPQEYTSQLDVKKKRQRTLTHTKSVQEKNSYAVTVWRRIKLKLEGRDPDPGVTSTISQQVDWTINEAMSSENLAKLYEGWTPWV